MKVNKLVGMLMFSAVILLSGCSAMNKGVRTEYIYQCEYPSEADVLPVPTISIAEYTETGLLEAYVLANSQLDKANIELMTIAEFIAKAKKIQMQQVQK